jgi:hypothetical protein
MQLEFGILSIIVGILVLSSFKKTAIKGSNYVIKVKNINDPKSKNDVFKEWYYTYLAISLFFILMGFIIIISS